MNDIHKLVIPRAIIANILVMKRIAPNESKKDKTASNVEIVNAFFTRDPVDRNLWICKCGKKRKQEPKTGYTNLVNHVKHEHTDVIEETLKKTETRSLR